MKWYVIIMPVTLGPILSIVPKGISGLEPALTNNPGHNNNLFDTSVAVYEHYKRKLYQNKYLERRSGNFHRNNRKKLLKGLGEVYNFGSNNDGHVAESNASESDSSVEDATKIQDPQLEKANTSGVPPNSNIEWRRPWNHPCATAEGWSHRRHHRRFGHPCPGGWTRPPNRFHSGPPPPFHPHPPPHRRPPPMHGMDWKILAAILGIIGMIITIIVSTVKHIYSRRSGSTTSTQPSQDVNSDGAVRRGVLSYRIGRAGYARQTAQSVSEVPQPERFPLPPSVAVVDPDIFSPPPYDIAITLPPSYDQITEVTRNAPPPPYQEENVQA